MSRSLAHAVDRVDVRSKEPVPRMTLPPIDVPGETPIDPVAMVVTVPSKVIAVPASTAKSEHAPRGISMTFPIANEERRTGTMHRIESREGDIL